MNLVANTCICKTQIAPNFIRTAPSPLTCYGTCSVRGKHHQMANDLSKVVLCISVAKDPRYLNFNTGTKAV